jgi:disulfide bond formation protein DsbB
MIRAQENLNALFILVLCLVILGGYTYQYTTMEQPCPLCLLQRLAMIGVAVGPLFNLLFGMKMPHYALSLISCILGGSVAIRQITLHICPQFSTFGHPVLGFDLYVWSLFVFVTSVFAIAVLLMLYGSGKYKEAKEKSSLFSKICIGLLAFVTLANVVTTFIECGISLCVG